MNLTLVFSRKDRWPEHYFSVWYWGNSQKLLTTNQFLVSTIFFTIINISFFSLRFDLFSIIAKEVNQIKSNVVCFRLVFHYGPLQCFSTYFRKLKKVGSFTTHISKLCYFLWLWFNFAFSSFFEQDHLLTFFCESMQKGALNVHVFQRRNWCNPKSDWYLWYVKKQSAK